MNASTRFLTGGLAVLAVTSAVTLAAPSAYAEDGSDRPCGQPAVPAVYDTVFHDPVLRQVPAVTHDAWLWQREVTTYEYEFSTVVSPETIEYLWSRTVVDQEAVPAVPESPEQRHLETVVIVPAVTETWYEYVQQQTGKTHWAPDGWNGQHGDVDDGKGWYQTGNTREEIRTQAVTEQRWVVDQPAVPETPAIEEITHEVTTWAHASPGDGWTGPHDSRTVPAVVDTVWAVLPPDGYEPTGAARVLDVTVEETDTAQAIAPAGDGWARVPGSQVVVVDVPAHDDQVGEGYSEQVLRTPAIPASDPCPQASPAIATPAGTAHQGSTATTSDKGATASAASAHGSPAHTATVLPATGGPASAWLVAAGAGALVAGSALVRVGRRRQTA